MTTQNEKNSGILSYWISEVSVHIQSKLMMYFRIQCYLRSGLLKYWIDFAIWTIFVTGKKVKI